MRNSSYLYQCNSRITVAIRGELSTCFTTVETHRFYWNCWEIYPGAAEKIWPMCCLFGCVLPLKCMLCVSINASYPEHEIIKTERNVKS